MTKTLFPKLVGLALFSATSNGAWATDSAASFEAMQRKIEKPAAAAAPAKTAPKKTVRKLKPKPVSRQKPIAEQKAEVTEEQNCFQDENGELWCDAVDENTAEQGNIESAELPFSDTAEEQSRASVSLSNSEPSFHIEPIGRDFTLASGTNTQQRAQEAADQAQLAAARANTAAAKAREAAGLSDEQTVSGLDFNGYGKQVWPEGTRHEGQWQNSKAHGLGIRTWQDGKEYEGEWQDDKRQGYGTQTWQTGERYQGSWSTGKKSGYGVYYWADGQQYQGEFNDGIIDGHGILTWPDGQYYQGAFTDDSFNGQGTLYSPKGSVLKKGTWRNGELGTCPRIEIL